MACLSWRGPLPGIENGRLLGGCPTALLSYVTFGFPFVLCIQRIEMAFFWARPWPRLPSSSPKSRLHHCLCPCPHARLRGQHRNLPAYRFRPPARYSGQEQASLSQATLSQVHALNFSDHSPLLPLLNYAPGLRSIPVLRSYAHENHPPHHVRVSCRGSVAARPGIDPEARFRHSTQHHN